MACLSLEPQFGTNLINPSHQNSPHVSLKVFLIVKVVD